VWSKGEGGSYCYEDVEELESGIRVVQALPGEGRVFGMYDGNIGIRIKDHQGGMPLKRVGQHSGLIDLQLLPDGRLFSLGAGGIRLWEKTLDGTWELRSQIENKNYEPACCMHVLPDGRVAVGRSWGSFGICQDGLELGDVTTPRHGSTLRCIQALPNGQIFTGYENGYVRVWDGDSIPKFLSGECRSISPSPTDNPQQGKR
jgi:WD40 repeat protein